MKYACPAQKIRSRSRTISANMTPDFVVIQSFLLAFYIADNVPYKWASRRTVEVKYRE